MDAWDGVLFALAAMVAVRALVHLARRRHELLVKEVQEQVDQHREWQEMQRRRNRKKKEPT